MTLQQNKYEEADYEYEIYIDDKLVWHGLNPDKIYERFLNENPEKRVSVGCRLKNEIIFI